jgi:hypothetical protein
MDASFPEILFILYSHDSCRPSGDCGGSRDRTRIKSDRIKTDRIRSTGTVFLIPILNTPVAQSKFVRELWYKVFDLVLTVNITVE